MSVGPLLRIGLLTDQLHRGPRVDECHIHGCPGGIRGQRRVSVCAAVRRASAARYPQGHPRTLSTDKQAVLVLRWYLDDTRMSALARDNGIALSTAYEYRDEGIAVLAAHRPSLQEALLAANPQSQPGVHASQRMRVRPNGAAEVSGLRGVRGITPFSVTCRCAPPAACGRARGRICRFPIDWDTHARPSRRSCPVFPPCLERSRSGFRCARRGNCLRGCAR